MSTTNIENVNIAAREHKTNPYPFYARLRAEKPVSPVTLPDKRTIWLVTRYDDVVTVLKDERFVKNPANVAPEYEAGGCRVPMAARDTKLHEIFKYNHINNAINDSANATSPIAVRSQCQFDFMVSLLRLCF